MRPHAPRSWKFAVLSWGAALAVALGPVPVWACPFCSAPGPTLAEDVANAKISILGKKLPTETADGDSQFEVVEVLRGKEYVNGNGKGTIATAFSPQPGDENSLWLLSTDDVESPIWSTPTPLSPAGVEYLRGSLSAPESGAARLAYFQKYLQSEDPICRSDSYMEFAKSPYEVVRALRPHLNRSELLSWLSAGEPSPDHKRLYLTLLGVCGEPSDAAMVAEMLSPDKIDAATLDATVGCYLTLGGEPALEKIEQEFLRRPDSDLSHIAAIVQALRFHGEEGDKFNKQRIGQAMKLLLARPDAADSVIFDLCRWEDWTLIEQLTQLFKDNDVEYIRSKVVTYLRRCPLPEAKERLAELAKLDPKAIERSQDPQAILRDILGQKTPALAPPPSNEMSPAPTAEGTAMAATPLEEGSSQNNLPFVRKSPEAKPAAEVASASAPSESGPSDRRMTWLLGGIGGMAIGIAVAAVMSRRPAGSLARVRQ